MPFSLNGAPIMAGPSDTVSGVAALVPLTDDGRSAPPAPQADSSATPMTAPNVSVANLIS